MYNQGCVDSFEDTERHIIRAFILFPSVMSLFGSSFILVNYMILSRGKNPLVKLLAFLSLGDFLWAISNLIAIPLLELEKLNWEACIAARASYQFAAGTTVLWTCCISFFLWRSICCNDSKGTWLKWSCFQGLSWGLPLTGAILICIFNKEVIYRNTNVGLCFLRQTYQVFAWFLPILVAFCFNTLIYLTIFIKIKTSNLYKLRNTAEKLKWRFTAYLLVYLVCWLPNVVSGLIDFFLPHCHIFILVVLYNFCLNSQGFLNCLVYGFTNRKIKEHFWGSGKAWLKALLGFFWSPFLLLPIFILFIIRKIRAEIGNWKKRRRMSLSNMVSGNLLDENEPLNSDKDESMKLNSGVGFEPTRYCDEKNSMQLQIQ
jgi:hypothetical protein